MWPHGVVPDDREGERAETVPRSEGANHRPGDGTDGVRAGRRSRMPRRRFERWARGADGV